MSLIRFNTLVLLTSALLGLVGCAESQFSSTPEVQAKASSQGLRVADVVEDGQIDDEEAAVIEDHLCGNKKVLVCHRPPGNLEALNEICISTSALAAHVSGQSALEDTIGECLQDDSIDAVELESDLSEDIKNQIGEVEGQTAGGCSGKKNSSVESSNVVSGDNSVVSSSLEVVAAQSGSSQVKFRRAK